MRIFRERFMKNWQSGLTVALVSIPLSVSLAVASQSTPTAGIITAIWAGLMAAIFGGSNFNVIGPTGALSGIIATYSIVHGAEAVPMLAVMTGVFIMVAYAFRLEKFLVFIPGSAVHGFTLGVAFIIAFSQTNFAIGLSGLPEHERFIENLLESFRHAGAFNPATAAVFAVFLALLFVLLRLVPRIPGAIILAPFGILLGYLVKRGWIDIGMQTLGERFPDMSAKLIEAPTLSFDASMIPVAAAVAVVAIIETMLSAKIADGMTKTKHDKRKEMFGLGLANIVSGAAGGIPATAALARTSLNVKSGADHRTSAIISCIGIALTSLLLLSTFSYIPLAVIAAILVFVAYRMIEREHFQRMWKHDKAGFSIALFVAFVTIYEDPIIGILLGVAIALLIFVEKLSHGHFEFGVKDERTMSGGRPSDEKLDDAAKKSETIVYSITGPFAYINAASHIARFEEMHDECRNVILRMRGVSYIDMDGVEAFDEIVELIQGQGKKVLVTGVNVCTVSLLPLSRTYQNLEKTGLVFLRTSDALASLGS